MVRDVGGRPQPGYYLPNDEVGHNEIVIMMSMKMLCYRLQTQSGVRMEEMIGWAGCCLGMWCGFSHIGPLAQVISPQSGH